MDIQPLPIPALSSASLSRPNPATAFFRSFRPNGTFIKEYAPITSLSLSSSSSVAVTSASRVQIYSLRSRANAASVKLSKTISRFTDTARGASLRPDGKLLVAGCDNGLVQLFDCSSRAILRTFNHSDSAQPVHVAKFFAGDNSRLLTCGDDTTVKVWDVATQAAIVSFSGHADYVRAGFTMPSSPEIVISASYDTTLRLWDCRSGKCEIVMTHGSAPVEDAMSVGPAGTLLASAGGPVVRLWDIVAGGRCVRAMSNHQKTVTSLCSVDSGSSSKALLFSAGLDGLCKVYDVQAGYGVVHSMRFAAPVLCMAVSPDCNQIITGLSDGTLSVRTRPKAARMDPSTAVAPIIDPRTYESTLDVAQSITTSQHVYKVQAKRTVKLKEYDKTLRAFRYAAALDAALKQGARPNVTCALIRELRHRDGLQTALKGRDDLSLEPILRFLIRRISDPRFTAELAVVVEAVLDQYSSVAGQSTLLDELFRKLRTKVVVEIEFQRDLQRLSGALSMIFAQSALQKNTLT